MIRYPSRREVIRRYLETEQMFARRVVWKIILISFIIGLVIGAVISGVSR